MSRMIESSVNFLGLIVAIGIFAVMLFGAFSVTETTHGHFRLLSKPSPVFAQQPAAEPCTNHFRKP